METRKSNEPDSTELRNLKRTEIDRGIDNLRRRIEELRSLGAAQYDKARKDQVEANIHATIRDVFGQNSAEFHDHGDAQLITFVTTVDGNTEMSLGGISETIEMLEGLIFRLEERREDVLPDSISGKISGESVAAAGRTVFVVHGHDEAAKEAVARFLEKLDLKPIILHEEPNRGRTIIEKFETHAEVDFAVVLLTPDDEGNSAGTPEQRKPRARQNVILELGYFVGRIGRARVCALHKGGIELPSDLAGLVYIPMDDHQGWRLPLAREIRGAGIKLDLNRAV
jgi:hypothetical protein